MGVYIDMDMPKSCLECRLYNDPWCMAKNSNQWKTAYNRPLKGERQNDCPLVPVPPHYDLIDHNALKIDVMDCDAETRIDFLKHAMDCINKAHVVIPSDMPTYEEEGEA